MAGSARVARQFLFAFFFLCLPQIAAAANPEQLAARYGALPHFLMPDLSPDGRYIASLEPVDGRFMLAVRPRDNPEHFNVIFRPADYDVAWFAWVDSERLVVQVVSPDSSGLVPVGRTRLYAVGRDGSNPLLLPNLRGTNRRPQSGSDIIAIPNGLPGQILMSWAGNRDGVPTAIRVNTYDGSYQQLDRGTARTISWFADPQGRLRLRTDFSGTTRTLYARAPDSPVWRAIRRVDLTKDPSFEPQAIDPDNPDILYVQSDWDTGRDAIYPYSMSTGTFGPALFSHPQYDAEGLLTGRDDRPIAALYTDDWPNIRYFGAEGEALQRRLDTGLPDLHNAVVSESRDKRFRIIASFGPNNSGVFHLDDNGNLTLLARRNPALADVRPSPALALRYTARDGVSIPAYLTLPAGASYPARGAAPLPLVVLPHGGPAVRSSLNYDYLSQYIASLGFAVLQPNFRGSSGYGRKFRDLGVRQWGKTMQDDVADGVQMLIDAGFADPARVCIAGGSYGGYAALMGAVRHAPLYRCAVSLNGIPDLGLYVANTRNFRFSEFRRGRIAAPAELRRMDGISPIENLDAIKAPILLIHGAKDMIVPVEQSLRMAQALDKAGKPHELALLPEGDHQLTNEPTRVTALKHLGAFLMRYIGPAADAGSAAPKS